MCLQCALRVKHFLRCRCIDQVWLWQLSSPDGFDLPPIRHTVRAIYVFMRSIYTYAVMRGSFRRCCRSHLCKHLSGLPVTHITVNNQLFHCTPPHKPKWQRCRESERSSQSESCFKLKSCFLDGFLQNRCTGVIMLVWWFDVGWTWTLSAQVTMGDPRLDPLQPGHEG